MLFLDKLQKPGSNMRGLPKIYNTHVEGHEVNLQNLDRTKDKSRYNMKRTPLIKSSHQKRNTERNFTTSNFGGILHIQSNT